MQRLAGQLLHGHLRNLPEQLGNAMHQAKAGFASKKDSKAADKPADLGNRFASQLNPIQRERMKTILGAQSLGGEAQQQGSGTSGSNPVPYVTISLLQTLKHLNTPDELKQRLMGYKVMSLNRQLEELHANSLQLLSSFKDAGSKQVIAKPAGQGLLKQLGRAPAMKP